MAASIMQVARTLGQISGWSLSNLEIQKIAYIAEMLHLGRNGDPLTNDQWQAWAYGPVEPELYHKAKVYGTSPVKDIFHAVPLMPGSTKYKAVEDAYKLMKNLTPGQMVAVTHKAGGAWAQRYRAGMKGLVISKSAIASEYGSLIRE